MKNRILPFPILLLLAYISFSENACSQEVGLRIENQNLGVDAIFPFEKSRLHADLMLHNSLFIFDGFSADALFDFIHKPIGKTDIHWYVGAGPSGTFSSSYAQIGGSGEAGIEYRFHDIPIILGVDGRVTAWVIGANYIDWDRFGFNARWVF